MNKIDMAVKRISCMNQFMYHTQNQQPMKNESSKKVNNNKSFAEILEATRNEMNTRKF